MLYEPTLVRKHATAPTFRAYMRLLLAFALVIAFIYFSMPKSPVRVLNTRMPATIAAKRPPGAAG